MYADDHGRQVTHRPSDRPSAGCPPGPVAVASAEGRHRQAKARLSAAQQESMEAGIEFLAARIALRNWMEEIWPGQEGEESAVEAADCPAPRSWR